MAANLRSPARFKCLDTPKPKPPSQPVFYFLVPKHRKGLQRTLKTSKDSHRQNVFASAGTSAAHFYCQSRPPRPKTDPGHRCKSIVKHSQIDLQSAFYYSPNLCAAHFNPLHPPTRPLKPSNLASSSVHVRNKKCEPEVTWPYKNTRLKSKMSQTRRAFDESTSDGIARPRWAKRWAGPWAPKNKSKLYHSALYPPQILKFDQPIIANLRYVKPVHIP